MTNCGSFPSSPRKMKFLLILLNVCQLWASSSARLTAEAARKSEHMLIEADALHDVKEETKWVGDAASIERFPPGSYMFPGFQGKKRDATSDDRFPPGSYRFPGFKGKKRDATSDERFPPGSYRFPGFQGKKRDASSDERFPLGISFKFE